MKTKRVTMPISIMLGVPSQWKAKFDGAKLTFSESYDESPTSDLSIAELISNTVSAFQSLAGLIGLDAKVEATENTVSLTVPGITGMRVMVSELLTQLEVHDQLAPGVYQAMLALLQQRPPPVPGQAQRLRHHFPPPWPESSFSKPQAGTL